MLMVEKVVDQFIVMKTDSLQQVELFKLVLVMVSFR